MELFLHIGTNKTGSSFLQSYLLENKELLLELGYFIPKSKWDLDILDGKISPGNGGELAWELARMNVDNVTNLLGQYFLEASNSNLKKVVVSNETLIRVFSDKECLELLELSARKIGFLSVHCLALFRNPYSHALSLYKHRNKFGNSAYSSYSSWLENDYEFFRLIKPFIDNQKNSSFNWSFELYERNQELLVNLFFNAWLGVNVPSPTVPKQVNGSLSLKEIRVIQRVDKNLSFFGRIAFEELIKVSQKQESNSLINEFNNCCKIYFENYSKEIHLISILLNGTNGNKYNLIPSVKQLSSSNEDFSTKQVDALIRALNKWKKDRIQAFFKSIILLNYMKIKQKFGKTHSINSKFGGSINK